MASVTKTGDSTAGASKGPAEVEAPPKTDLPISKTAKEEPPETASNSSGNVSFEFDSDLFLKAFLSVPSRGYTGPS